jgi:hypothetical protein
MWPLFWVVRSNYWLRVWHWLVGQGLWNKARSRLCIFRSRFTGRTRAGVPGHLSRWKLCRAKRSKRAQHGQNRATSVAPSSSIGMNDQHSSKACPIKRDFTSRLHTRNLISPFIHTLAHTLIPIFGSKREIAFPAQIRLFLFIITTVVEETDKREKHVFFIWTFWKLPFSISHLADHQWIDLPRLFRFVRYGNSIPFPFVSMRQTIFVDAPECSLEQSTSESMHQRHSLARYPKSNANRKCCWSSTGNGQSCFRVKSSPG